MNRCVKYEAELVSKYFPKFFSSKYVSNFPSCIVVLEISGFKICPKLLGHPVDGFIPKANHRGLLYTLGSCKYSFSRGEERTSGYYPVESVSKP